MTDGYHSGERYSVVRELTQGGVRTYYVVIDHQDGNRRLTRHRSSAAAHRAAAKRNRSAA